MMWCCRCALWNPFDPHDCRKDRFLQSTMFHFGLHSSGDLTGNMKIFRHRSSVCISKWALAEASLIQVMHLRSDGQCAGKLPSDVSACTLY